MGVSIISADCNEVGFGEKVDSPGKILGDVLGVGIGVLGDENLVLEVSSGHEVVVALI